MSEAGHECNLMLGELPLRWLTACSLIVTLLAGEAPPMAEQEDSLQKVSPALAMGNLVERVVPVYPPIARSLRLVGEVEVGIVVDTEGRVIEAKILRGSKVFSAPSLDVIRKWRFRPFHIKGAVAKVKTTVTLEFRP